MSKTELPDLTDIETWFKFVLEASPSDSDSRQLWEKSRALLLARADQVAKLQVAQCPNADNEGLEGQRDLPEVHTFRCTFGLFIGFPLVILSIVATVLTVVIGTFAILIWVVVWAILALNGLCAHGVQPLAGAAWNQVEASCGVVKGSFYLPMYTVRFLTVIGNICVGCLRCLRCIACCGNCLDWCFGPDVDERPSRTDRFVEDLESGFMTEKKKLLA